MLLSEAQFVLRMSFWIGSGINAAAVAWALFSLPGDQLARWTKPRITAFLLLVPGPLWKNFNGEAESRSFIRFRRRWAMAIVVTVIVTVAQVLLRQLILRQLIVGTPG